MIQGWTLLLCTLILLATKLPGIGSMVPDWHLQPQILHLPHVNVCNGYAGCQRVIQLANDGTPRVDDQRMAIALSLAANCICRKVSCVTLRNVIMEPGQIMACSYLLCCPACAAAMT